MFCSKPFLFREKNSPQFKRLFWGLDLLNIEDRFSHCPVSLGLVNFSSMIVSSQVCDVKYSREVSVFQCTRGHYLCGDCRPRLNPDHCPVCRGEITGRAVDFEKFLVGLYRDTK